MQYAIKTSHFTRTFLMPLMLLMMIFAVSGCGDKEPAQRKADRKSVV